MYVLDVSVDSIKCPWCDVTKSRRGLACHVVKAHGRSVEELCVVLFHGGVRPKCCCGCKTELAFAGWTATNRGFNDYVRGHNGFTPDARLAAVEASTAHRRIHGSWNKGLTKETHDVIAKSAARSSATLREGHASGRIVAWQQGLTKSTSSSLMKLSTTQAQRHAAGLARVWTTGLTKETSSKVAAAGRRISASKMLSIDEVVRRFESVDGFTLLDPTQYEGVNRRMDVECDACGHVMRRTVKWITARPMCMSCSPRSHGQRELFEFVRSLDVGHVVEDARDVITPLELDVWVPAHRFAVEFNGLWWHDEHARGRDYHNGKTRTCRDNDVRLMHVFEDEWRDRRPIVESMIRARLGRVTSHHDARKFSVEHVSGSDHAIVEFMNENHIDGHVQADDSFVLVDGSGVMRAAATFRVPRRKSAWHTDAANPVELVRFATCRDTCVRGALGRLTTARKRMSNCTIVSYVDLRHGTGASYDAVGFRPATCPVTSTPRFWWTDHVKRWNRLKFKADKVRGMTEQDVADEAGVVRIFGCTNRRLVL